MQRRNFLGVGAAVVLTACTPDDSPEAEQALPDTTSTGASPRVFRIRHPIMVPFGEDVMIVAEMREGPIAQYMMAEKAIYVTAANRDRVAQHLGARVSGRTWAWQARDGEKQAEEMEYRPYDPTRDPQIGDVKISEWECNTVVAAGACHPLVGAGLWIKCPDITRGLCIGDRERLCSEIFDMLGTCDAFADAACTQPAGQRRLVGWSCLDL